MELSNQKNIYKAYWFSKLSTKIIEWKRFFIIIQNTHFVLWYLEFITLYYASMVWIRVHSDRDILYSWYLYLNLLQRFTNRFHAWARHALFSKVTCSYALKQFMYLLWLGLVFGLKSIHHTGWCLYSVPTIGNF